MILTAYTNSADSVFPKNKLRKLYLECSNTAVPVTDYSKPSSISQKQLINAIRLLGYYIVHCNMQRRTL